MRTTAAPMVVVSRNHDQGGKSHDPLKRKQKNRALELIHDQLSDTEKPPAEPRVGS